MLLLPLLHLWGSHVRRIVRAWTGGSRGVPVQPCCSPVDPMLRCVPRVLSSPSLAQLCHCLGPCTCTCTGAGFVWKQTVQYTPSPIAHPPLSRRRCSHTAPPHLGCCQVHSGHGGKGDLAVLAVVPVPAECHCVCVCVRARARARESMASSWHIEMGHENTFKQSERQRTGVGYLLA